VLTAALAVLTAACTSNPRAEAPTKQQVIVDEATITLGNFAAAPEMEWFRDNVDGAKAVLIMPNQVKGGFIVGGSGGSGVLLTKGDDGSWSYPAFYSIGSATLGLQIGGEVSELVLLVMTEAGKQSLLSPSLKLGADASVAAGPIGVGAKAQTADILAFARSKGLYGGLNLEGAVVTPRSEWNQAYYDRPVTPAEILVDRDAQNPHADSLRQELNELVVASR
jgi:lipid-binding SYLF domain-containing protein